MNTPALNDMTASMRRYPRPELTPNIADPERLEVLVEGGGEEQGDEGEEVAEPRGGAPAVEEDRGGLAPVEGHVHHGGRPGGNGGSG